jgi:hypothetical protein
MRAVLLSAGLLLVVGVSDAAAALPTRDCDSRGEGTGPIRQLAGPGDLQLGPVAFMGLHRLADPAEFERHRNPRGGYGVKTPLAVRAGRVVTVSVRTSGARLAFVRRPQRGVSRIRFVACDRNERAFSYNGRVGGVTGFPGGFSLDAPACVTVRVGVRGGRRYSATVPFGTGGCGLARSVPATTH